MKKKVLFIHHSTGGNLLREGDIRMRLAKLTGDIELWDHGYNLYPYFGTQIARLSRTFHTGLSDAAGQLTGRDFQLEVSNKDVGDYVPIFSESNKYLKEILAFDAVIFKMCYPSTRIETARELEEIQRTYAEIAAKLKGFKSTNFGIFTPPPLRMEATTSENGLRLLRLREWMLAELPADNIQIFDFCGLLVDLDQNSPYFGTLKREYCRTLWLDSHPNAKANQEASDSFVRFIADLSL